MTKTSWEHKLPDRWKDLVWRAAAIAAVEDIGGGYREIAEMLKEATAIYVDLPKGSKWAEKLSDLAP